MGSNYSGDPMKLYYSTGACSLSPRIVAFELGLKLEGIKADLKNKKTEKGDDYLKITPKGQVPALQLDNGEVLTEGVAIVQYMASLVPGTKMMPEGFAKFRQLEWLNYITSELHKTYSGFFNPHATDTEKEHLRTKLAHKFAHLEPVLTKNTYIMGNDFTCADAYLFNVLSWSGYVKVELPKFLQDYSARVAQRPAVQDAMKAEGLSK
jgi:glutathione S-transferase